jgi:two-component system, chemotaxis family, chemotaxis protein CheY
MSKIIMTVDDSASVRQMVAFTLRSAGYEVIEAADGVEALARMQGRKMSAIITDLNMPNMDGIELTQKIRSDATYRFTPIILLTTESQETMKQKGRAAGATGWIVKPFKPEQLLGVVKKVVG